MTRARGEWSAEEGRGAYSRLERHDSQIRTADAFLARFCCWDKTSSGGVQPACGVMAPDEVGTGAERPGACIAFVASARHRSCLPDRFGLRPCRSLLGLPLPISHPRVRWTPAWHNYIAQSLPRAAEPALGPTVPRACRGCSPHTPCAEPSLDTSIPRRGPYGMAAICASTVGLALRITNATDALLDSGALRTGRRSEEFGEGGARVARVQVRASLRSTVRDILTRRFFGQVWRDCPPVVFRRIPCSHLRSHLRPTAVSPQTQLRQPSGPRRTMANLDCASLARVALQSTVARTALDAYPELSTQTVGRKHHVSTIQPFCCTNLSCHATIPPGRPECGDGLAGALRGSTSPRRQREERPGAIFSHTTPHRCAHVPGTPHPAVTPCASPKNRADRHAENASSTLAAYTTLREGHVPVCKHDAPPPFPSVRTPLRDRFTLKAMRIAALARPILASIHPHLQPPLTSQVHFAVRRIPYVPPVALCLVYCTAGSSLEFWSYNISCEYVLDAPTKSLLHHSPARGRPNTFTHSTSRLAPVWCYTITSHHRSSPGVSTHYAIQREAQEDETSIQLYTERHPRESVAFAPLVLNPHSKGGYEGRLRVGAAHEQRTSGGQ